jgi:hypothetical protein
MIGSLEKMVVANDEDIWRPRYVIAKNAAALCRTTIELRHS